VTFNAANAIGNPSFFTTNNGAFAVTDAQALTITGPLLVNGALSLTTTGTNDGLAIDGMVEGGTITLTSAATTSESNSGAVQGTTLTGSALGALSLMGVNGMANLGAFSSNGGSLSFADARSLTVTGTLSAGTGTSTRGAEISNDNIDIDAAVVGSAVSLESEGTISSNSSGKIKATMLTGSSHGAVAPNGTNVIDNLGTFSSGGNNALSLTDAHSLRTLGTVDAGTAALSLTTSGAGHNLNIEGTLAGGAVTLTSAGFIREYLHRGAIHATTLSGSSVRHANLGGMNNSVADLDGFVSGGNHRIRFIDDRSLAVTGDLDSGQHRVLIVTRGVGHNVALDGSIEARGLVLTSSRGITEGGSAAIDVAKLAGSSAGGANLTNGEGIIADLGTFISGGPFELTDDHNLTVSGLLDAGSHAIDLTTAGSADDPAIDGTIISGTIDLAATGKANESKMGAIDAIKLLNVTAGTGIELTSKRNDIKKLGTHATVVGPNKVTL
jgi:hypothetical protein